MNLTVKGTSSRGMERREAGRSLVIRRMENQGFLDLFPHCLGTRAQGEESSGHWSSQWGHRNLGSTGMEWISQSSTSWRLVAESPGGWAHLAVLSSPLPPALPPSLHFLKNRQISHPSHTLPGCTSLRSTTQRKNSIAPFIK